MSSGTYSTRRRLVASLVIVMLVTVLFVIRLVDLQVVRASELVADGREKMTGSRQLYAPRGNIVDTNGTVLAQSVSQFKVEASPKDVKEYQRRGADGKLETVTVEQTYREMGEALGVSPESLQSIIDSALERDKNSAYAIIAPRATFEQFQALRSLRIGWLYITQTFGRAYPNGAVAGNIVGFVGASNEGQAGMELQREQCLVGTDGLEQYQQSKDRVALPGTSEILEEARPGGELALTIDADLNWTVQQLVAAQVEATGAEYGMAMITEVKTGKIRAVAEVPSVDPGNVDGTPAEFRGSRAFQAPFEPGSIFKPLTAAILIDTGEATPNSQIVAEYRKKFNNGASIKDALPHDPQNLTLTGVLQQSSNTGLVGLGEKLDLDTRRDYLEKFGIGSVSDIKFGGESAGILRPTKDWDAQTAYVTMIGQGLSVTAAQMAGAFQTLGNGGVRMPLQLIEGCSYPDGTVTDVPERSEGTRVISEKAADETIAMMETVVTEGFLAEQLTMPGYRVAAKSGTGEQFVEGKLEKTFFASMAGVVPADNPEYVITVHLKSPLTFRSSAAAAPVFKEVVSQVIKKYGIAPATTPGPDLKGTF